MGRKLHQVLCADDWSSVGVYSVEAAAVHPVKASLGSAHSHGSEKFLFFYHVEQVSTIFIFCLF